jgi:hypothetical protein
MTAPTTVKDRLVQQSTDLYPEYKGKRASAIRWRLDHYTDADRDRSWRAFTVGALWLQRQPVRDAIRAGLRAAEREIPYGVCDVLVDIGRRCGQPLPCPDHPTS